MINGRELGAFLRSRREQLRPADLGLVDHGRCRVPGLRREELASLAGVSVAYDTRLEQSHDKSPSASVIDALVDALRLDTGAREHLHLLARPADGRAGSRIAEPERVRVELAELLEHHVGAPAMVLERALDVLAANPVAGILHPSYRLGRNLALDVFLAEGVQALYADPEQVRRNRTGALRVAAGALPGDPRLVEVVGELGGSPGSDQGGIDIRNSARLRLTSLVADGSVEIVMGPSFPLADVAKAHRQLTAGKIRGRIVLIP